MLIELVQTCSKCTGVLLMVRCMCVSFGAHCLCNVLKPSTQNRLYTKALFPAQLSDLELCLCRLQELDWLKGHEAKEAAAKGIAGHKLPISVA